MRRDLVERDREDVVEDEGDSLGRGQRVEHDEQRQPDRVGEEGLVLGVESPDTAVGSGKLGVGGGWGRDLRAWSMFRQTRETTVVSQPPRLSTPLVSERLKRSQASWTASSASLGEPRIR